MQMRTFQDQALPKAATPIPGQPGPTRNVAAVMLGRRLLTKMADCRNMAISAIPQDVLGLLLERHGARSLESLYEDIGTGKLPASTVVSYLLIGRPVDK